MEPKIGKLYQFSDNILVYMAPYPISEPIGHIPANAILMLISIHYTVEDNYMNYAFLNGDQYCWFGLSCENKKNRLPFRLKK